MNLFLSHPLLQEHIKNRKHFKFHLSDLPSIEWHEILQCLSYAVKNNLHYREFDKGGIILWDYYSLKKIHEVVQQFNCLNPDRKSNGHLYISLTDSANTLPLHRDKTPVIYWQAIGKVEFTVKQNFETYNYILEQNDCIYVPNNVMHKTRPLTPRVGISLGFEEKV